MVQVTVEQASRQLPELLAAIDKGEQVMITREDAPPAMLSTAYPKIEISPQLRGTFILEPVNKPREPGSGRGQVLYMADDFNAPIDDLFECMQ